MTGRRKIRKGRGALSNPAGRFETTRVEALSDEPADSGEELPPLETVVLPEHAKTILTRNDSPDIGFDVSINPYRGCEHGCVYCLSGDTAVLLPDGNTRPLAELDPGDEICGTRRHGHYRRYARTQVLARWTTCKPAYRVTLADGTELVASGDHRFLTERGWKFVDAGTGGQRPHLTTNNSLLGIGNGGSARTPARCDSGSADFRRGYLSGIIHGDGTLLRYSYPGRRRPVDIQYRFRLAMADAEPLDRAAQYLSGFGIWTQRAAFGTPRPGYRAMEQIRTSSRAGFESVEQVIAWPERPGHEWGLGYLAGLFDAEGSFSDGILRISNSDLEILAVAQDQLSRLGFDCIVDTSAGDRPRPMHCVRIRGGLREHLRFFRLCQPALGRRRSILEQCLKSTADLRVVSIEALPGLRELHDITTGTGDFIANGTVSHNCYARPGHAYVNLSPGLDFETRLFYKQDAAKLLDAELRRRTYACKPVNIGASTDPYQPIERKLRVTRSLLEVLHRFRHPLTIVTKSTLVERDIDLLADMARDDLVNVFLSITTLDPGLKRTLEPRTPSPAARLQSVRALSEAGVPVGVLVAPIIPAVNDAEIERIVELSAAAGARSCGYVLLRLPWEVKDLFREWLTTHLPLRAEHVMSLVNAMRSGKDNDSRFGVRMRGEGPFAELIRARFDAACRRHGLSRAWKMTLSTAHFRVPDANTPQLTLF